MSLVMSKQNPPSPKFHYLCQPCCREKSNQIIFVHVHVHVHVHFLSSLFFPFYSDQDCMYVLPISTYIHTYIRTSVRRVCTVCMYIFSLKHSPSPPFFLFFFFFFFLDSFHRCFFSPPFSHILTIFFGCVIELEILNAKAKGMSRLEKKKKKKQRNKTNGNLLQQASFVT